ncbi:NAD(P)/FAD-dependent oxidoreductase [Penaeicola halotolerans]|uniref:NAD(P)/FAD-dependent oxidoreductase n=1 Tax=Penaeicola halotolerans TaxID=2793196 RepID=UPI001CF8CAA3|nr:FAD-dependent oxidoreductase [Penaeicola halotolerans]
MISIWEKKHFVSFDYLIIGGGIVGLSTAIHLKEHHPHAQVAILERGLFPSGASTKNAGFACFGSLTELLDDLAQTNSDTVLKTVESRWLGLQKLRSKLGDRHIDFQNHGGYELLGGADLKALDQMQEINEWLKPLFGKAVFSIQNEKIDQFGFSKNAVKSLVWNAFEGQIDTGLMMKSLHQLASELGVKIYTGAHLESYTLINNDVACQVNTLQGSYPLKTKSLIFCTNAFTKQHFPNLDIQPGRGMVMVTTPIKDLKFEGTFHIEKGYYYFRNYQSRLLIGGGRHLDFAGETSYDFGLNPKISSAIHQLIQEVILPDQAYEIDLSWSGIMAFGQSKSPIIQQLEPNVYAACRLGGMGVAIGWQVGETVAKLVLEA